MTALFAYAKKQGIEVDFLPLRAGESLSVPLPGGGYGVAIDPEKVASPAEERVKLAHELGHCCTGSFYNRYASCDLRQRHENRADRWAIKRLITEEALKRAVARGHTEIWDLAECFGVTEEFMRKAVCWYSNGNLDVEDYF